MHLSTFLGLAPELIKDATYKEFKRLLPRAKELFLLINYLSAKALLDSTTSPDYLGCPLRCAGS